MSTTRRDFLVGASLIGTSVAAALSSSAQAADTPAAAPSDVKDVKSTRPGPVEFMALPYTDTALAPAISQETISFHYGKHHKGYVDKTNELIQGTPLADLKLREIVVEAKKQEKTKLFNMSAQVWNHNFYWKSMKASGGGAPVSGPLLKAIQASFGDVAALKKAFGDEAKGAFGSAWVWLVEKKDKLAIVTTSNAETPLTGEDNPLLVIDVWEHAYYVDYRNKRADYVDAWLDKLVNWEFAEQNLQRK